MGKIAGKCSVCRALVEFEAEEKTVVCERCHNVCETSAMDNYKNEGFIIEDGVLKAYTGCASDIVIPYGVKEIKGECFNGKRIKSVDIPGTLRKIGFCAFRECFDDDVLHFSVFIQNLTNWCCISFDGYESNPLNVGADLFLNGKKVTKLIVPDGVVAISDFAFGGCSSITEVQMNGELEYVGCDAFRKCSNLTTVTMSERLKEIGSGAFLACSNLDTIILPNSVINVGSSAFSSCENLKSVVLSENMMVIERWSFFGCEKLGFIKIPDGVIAIDDNAFANCTGLTSVLFPESLKHIGVSAFYNCKSLVDLVIPENVTRIGEYAFLDYWQSNGLCVHCGGKLRKIFSRGRCKKCGLNN